MSTAQVAPARAMRGRKVLLKGFATVLLAVVGAMLAAAGWFYWTARAALPQLDGTILVAGLSAPVGILRDPQGVPHIRAQTLQDALFAQGYVTAQDRLWQMDMTRRWAAGELAEILDATWVAHDRQQRILSLHQVAERSAAKISADEKKTLEAYVDGVNAFIAAHRDNLPIEFRLLRYQPRRWTAEDSFLVGAGMAQELNFSLFKSELEREKITRKIGPELAAWLYPNKSWRDRPPSMAPPPRHALQPEAGPGQRRIPSAAPVTYTENVGQDLLSPGSNNWVVAGAHTVSGKPLLSNDMHLRHQIPNVWYEMHLAAPGLDVAGVTLPGLPYVVVGHNQRIAWGFTNLGPDVQDIFIETFNAQGEYQTPRGWLRPERRQEIIHVKGAPDVEMEVVTTRHGPIATELAGPAKFTVVFGPAVSPHSEDLTERRKLALKWSVYDTGLDLPFGELDAARNWQEFRHALRRLTAPSQNTVYADVDGHIGYQATGSIPIRRSGDGALPIAGNDDAHEWTGYVPYDKLPSVYDPPSGVLATANGRITPDGYPFPLGTQWGAPYRTQRIYQVLESGARFSREDMLGLQNDIYSEFDQLCAQRMASAVESDPTASSRAREAAALLRSWDGRMSKDSAAATIEIVARARLWELLLTAKGIDPKDYTWYSAALAMENILARQPREWLPAQYSDYNQLLVAAVEAAVSKPQQKPRPGRQSSAVPWLETAYSFAQAPQRLSSWRRGWQFPLEMQHPIFGSIPVLNHWSGPGRVEQSGGAYTVKQVGTSFGPSQRMTVDFADLDHSTLNIVTGQSGQIFSPYYMDQWKAWYEGTSFALPFSSAAVERARVHELQLIPGR